MTLRIGLIINPIAGLGGTAALKGSDGEDAARRAIELGAKPMAAVRSHRFLRSIAQQADRLELLAGAGPMGADVARLAGLPAQPCGVEAGSPTTSADTKQAAAAMMSRACDLVVFAGGDGTARDVLDAVGERIPVLGIPAGVKMHSGVFAISPEAAARVVERLLLNKSQITFRSAEVMDVDETKLREGHVVARLYGYARVPFEKFALQGPKLGNFSEDAALEGAAEEVVHEMVPGTLYVVGPGTTMRMIKRKLGTEGTLLGVDAFLDRRIVGLDLTSDELLCLAADKPLRIVLGVIGGQGFLLGRGNQQLSPPLVRQCAGLIIVASRTKLAAMNGAPLRVDTGDLALDSDLSGYVRIVTGRRETAIAQIAMPL